MYWFIGSLPINNVYSSHRQTSCKESVVSGTKGNVVIKQVLKENGCNGSIIGTSFNIITNNHSFCQSLQQTQATGIKEEMIRVSINKLTLHWRY